MWYQWSVIIALLLAAATPAPYYLLLGEKADTVVPYPSQERCNAALKVIQDDNLRRAAQAESDNRRMQQQGTPGMVVAVYTRAMCIPG